VVHDVKRPLATAIAAISVIGLGACGSESPSSTIQGEVNRFEVGAGAQPSMVQVSLEETELGGLRSVSVYFDPEELACDDGSRLDVEELRPGQPIAFAIDDDVSTPELQGAGSGSFPGSVGGRELRVDCAADAARRGVGRSAT
jgi:hypothetical protein